MAINLTRRNFLKTASIAAASLPLSKVVAQAESGLVKAPLIPPGSFKNTQTVSGGVCEMCFWRCQLVGKVRDGRLIKLEGNPKSIDNGLSICARGNAGVKLLYDPDRLKYPLKNVGKRGAPKWQRITWEEALDTCGSKLKAIVDQHGAKGIAMFPHGSSATYPMGFFEHAVGTHNISEASFFQCRGIRDTAYIATIGLPPNEDVDMANTKVIFLLGNHLGENIHVSHLKRYLKGLENGAKLVVVDPRYSASAAKAHVWVQIRPGTDTAFLLAIMNYLIQNKKYNAAFVEKQSEGFQQMADGIKGWTLEKAAQECDVPAAQIKEVAELLAANMPNVSIHPGRHVSWNGNDFQRQRALACLTGLLGAFGVKGSFVQPKGPKGLAKVGWPKGEKHDQSLREMKNVHHFSPPGTPTDLIRDTAITGNPYPIKGCVIWGQNPIQTIPNQEKTIKMLEQMDFVMCVDVMPTDITLYADILLPDTSYLERYDMMAVKTGTQWDFAAEHQQYIAPRMPLVAPGFERKESVWITNEIAKRMGYGEKIPVQSQEEGINKILAGVQLSIDQIKAEDGIHIQPGKDPYGEMDITVLFANAELAEKGYPAIPTYIPVERAPEGYARLLYGRAPVHTFNRSQNNAWLMAEMDDSPVWVNDKLAAKLGFKNGDKVALVNQDGVKSRTTTKVKVTPGIRQDCVYMYHGFGSMNPELTVGYNKGIDDTSMITKLAVDPETGAHGMRNNFVKLVKVS